VGSDRAPGSILGVPHFLVTREYNVVHFGEEEWVPFFIVIIILEFLKRF